MEKGSAVLFFFVFYLCSLGSPIAGYGRESVLVVMSYHQSMSWVHEVEDGINSILAPHYQITYLYLDTKNNLAWGPREAEKAFELYRTMQPVGLLAVVQ